MSRLCFEGPEAELTDTANAQPAILVTSLALYAALSDRIQPGDCVAGHSLGEYTALVVAGSLAAPDAIRLTRQRGEWMKKAGDVAPGGMAAILNMEDAPIETACQQARDETGGVVQIANYNSPGQIVISGDVKHAGSGGGAAQGAGRAASHSAGGQRGDALASDGVRVAMA